MLLGNPNPRTESEIVCGFLIRSAPCHQTPDHRPQRQHRNRRIPTIDQRSGGNQPRHRSSARAHGPNRRLCADIPFSPDHTIQHQTTDPLQQHKTAEYQQPTCAADISHLADAAWQPKSADWIANRTPIPNPVRATHPDSRPSTRPIPSKPQNTNTQATLRRRSTDPPAIRQPTPADQIGNHILTSGPVRTCPIPPATETPAVGHYLPLALAGGVGDVEPSGVLGVVGFLLVSVDCFLSGCFVVSPVSPPVGILPPRF